MKRIQTITFDGSSDAEYKAMLAHLDTPAHKEAGWTLIKDPIAKRVTAVKTDDVQLEPIKDT